MANFREKIQMTRVPHFLFVTSKYQYKHRLPENLNLLYEALKTPLFPVRWVSSALHVAGGPPQLRATWVPLW